MLLVADSECVKFMLIPSGSFPICISGKHQAPVCFFFEPHPFLTNAYLLVNIMLQLIGHQALRLHIHVPVLPYFSFSAFRGVWRNDSCHFDVGQK